MTEYDIQLVTLILGVLIWGVGYVGMGMKHLFNGSDFKKLSIYDKTIQSIVFGTVTFIFTLYFVIKPASFDENALVNSIMQKPIFFFVQFISMFILAEYWQLAEVALSKIFNSPQQPK